MTTLTHGHGTDVGLVREENEDFFGKFPEDNLNLTTSKGHIFIVADGMGGHNAGREASELAVSLLAYYYFSIPTDDIAESLRRAFRGANEHIHTYSKSSPDLTGMGTTCVALVIKDERAYVGHIGDSRVYRITKRKITQLTQDHSKVAEMVRRGILTHDEATIHPHRSYLYRAMGMKPEVEVDIIDDIELKNDDWFLLCTDGLYNHVTNEEMQKLVVSNPPEASCKALIELAKERGGLDNITVQVVRVKKDQSFFNKILGT